ncbi:MAG: hypothetical protein MPJ50_05575 [Pirellulales bacterium]|nr:hypothetical protein [Pirellulales bacterium]
MPHNPLDTTPEAYAVQQEVLRKLGGSRRAELALEWSAKIRETAMAGIRSRNPHYSSRQVVLAYARMTLGEKLFREAFADEIALIDK